MKEKLQFIKECVNIDEKTPNTEYKIALYTSFHAFEFHSELLSDFHFLRQ